MRTLVDPQARAPAQDRTPNQAALSITGRPYLSYTQITLMRSCPRKFAFQYVERAPWDFLAASRIFGGAIHHALEVYFRAKLKGQDLSSTSMMAAFSDSWRRQQVDGTPVRFGKRESWETILPLAQRMIDSFLHSALAQPMGRIVGIEEELKVELVADLPDILARVDLIMETDCTMHVVDFKTSKSRWSEQMAHENAEQLRLYGMTLQSLSHAFDRPIKLHFAVITKSKIPIVQLFPVSADGNRIACVAQSIRQVWQAIEAGNFYPSPSPINCAMCQFRSRCPAFASGK